MEGITETSILLKLGLSDLVIIQEDSSGYLIYVQSQFHNVQLGENQHTNDPR